MCGMKRLFRKLLLLVVLVVLVVVLVCCDCGVRVPSTPCPSFCEPDSDSARDTSFFDTELMRKKFLIFWPVLLLTLALVLSGMPEKLRLSVVWEGIMVVLRCSAMALIEDH